MQSPASRLVVRSTADTTLNVTLRLIDLSNEQRVYDQTQTIDPGETIRLDDHFKPGADYKFTMDIDNETVFQRHIYSYAGYKVAIRSKTTAEVTSQTEI